MACKPEWTRIRFKTILASLTMETAAHVVLLTMTAHVGCLGSLTAIHHHIEITKGKFCF